jgi:cytochrome P450 family 12
MKMIRSSKVFGRHIFQLQRNLSAQPAISIKQSEADYGTVKRFEDMPTLSRFELIKRFMPGGKFHQVTMPDVQKMLQDELGTIYRMPGMFGQNTNVSTFDAEDIEYIHRNEGVYPYRRGMETMKYFRAKVRPEIFDIGGLIVE